jgi:hypothetical protein
MEKIKGQIQKISVTDGVGKLSNKPFKRWEYLIDEKKYSTFDEAIGSSFNVGDFVEMEGSQKGTYWNMTSMKKASPDLPSPKDYNSVELLRQILAELKTLNTKANGNS